MILSRINTLLEFALECLTSPLIEGEFINIEIIEDSTEFSKTKSFKAKATGKSRLSKYRDARYFEYKLTRVPPKFRGGVLIKRNSKNGKPVFFYKIGKSFLRVRVRKVKKAQEDDNVSRVESRACT